jgi:gamma-glutamyltranspeptidase/glutathione hydrolase
VTEPLTSSYQGVEVLTAPPNSQGFVLLEILEAISILEECPDPLGKDAPLLSEICRLAARDRDRFLADPRFAEFPVDSFTSGEYGAQLLARAQSQLRSARRARSVTSRASKGDTVAVVAADSEGNAVSIIQSIFHTFGARILEPRTGILCHNRGALFSLDPTSPNVLAPRKRPAHTLMPVLIRREGALVGVQGAMGGKAQPQIHLQLLLRTLRSEPPDVALAAPRWVVGGLEAGQPTDVTRVEASAAPTVGRFRDAGMTVEVLADRDEEVGHGQLVIRDRDGGLQAGSDPRSDGTAVFVTR